MKSGDVNSKNFSAFNNTSTLLLLLQLESSKTDELKNDNVSISKLKQVLDQKMKLIKSDYFVDYCLSIGVKSDINTTEIQKFFTETMLEVLNQNFTNKQLLELVSGLDADLSEAINSSLVKEPISNIKEQLKISAAALKDNVKEGLVIGKILIKNTVSDIRYLKETLGVKHYNYESLAGNLSNQILQCGINYFNETGDDQSYLNSYKYALSIAPNEKTKSRAKDTIKHCEEEKVAKICKFCNENEVLTSTGIRVKMHKMTSHSAYSYFKDGGLELKCCASCKNKKSSNKILSPILATIIYAVITLVTSGILIGIDFLFTRFAIGKWWFKLIDKEIYFKNIAKHPLIVSTLKEGYEFGTP